MEQLDWTQLDEFSYGAEAVSDPLDNVDFDALFSAPSSPLPPSTLPSPSERALPAIVLPPLKKRKRIEWPKKPMPSKPAPPPIEIRAEARRALVSELIGWFLRCGYVLRSYASPYDDVAQLGYMSEAFLKEKGVRVAVLRREFPKPVCTFTVRIFDRVGRFPTVFVSSADGVAAELKRVESVEHLEATARQVLPQFDVETGEVSTVFGVMPFLKRRAA